MLKRLTSFLLCVFLFGVVVMPVNAKKKTAGYFAFTATTANNMLVEPEYIPYTEGQTIKEALLATEHEFVGLEQGFIYSVDGTDANFGMFYNDNGYNLDVEAESITALCLGVTSLYSPELITLIDKMAEYNNMGNVVNYETAKAAYNDACKVIRNGEGTAATEALTALSDAIDEYNSIVNGKKYTVSIVANQGENILLSPTVSFTDQYGNVTETEGTQINVVAGEYSVIVSDGGYNRTEGTFEVTDTIEQKLEVTLPSGEWFGDVKLLNGFNLDEDGNKVPYNSVIDKKNHTAQFFVYDTAREQSSIYLNVMQAAVPDENNTKLKTIYTSVIGIDYSQQIRSWESENTALVGLVKQGMEGAVFPLEAQYTDSNGNVQIQSYDITVTRVPTLKSITLDAQGTILPLEFNPVTLSYDVTTVSDKLNIAAEPFGENYIVSGTGDVNISDESCFEITVGYGEQENTYKINVSKASSVPVTLNTPSGVTVQVVNAAGSVISPVDGVYNLIPDESYTYTATKNDVYKSKAAFVASANAVIDVAEPVAEDWLNDFVLYNNFNVSTRLEYKADSGFKPDDHSYIYTVPDTNTTLYAQATSDYSVSAIYSTQTTYVNTHNVSKNIVIDKAVSSGGATNTLTQAIAKSGYANDVTVRVSKTEESITYYQDYEITLAKKLHLVSLAVLAGEEKLTFSSDSGATVSFDRDVTEYTVNIDSGLTSINLNGEFPNTSENTDCCGGYYAVINNVSYSDISNLVLPLNTEKYNETIEIVVKHADTNSIETTYTVNVKKTDPVDITIATTPADAVIFLTNDFNGKRVYDENGVYKLTPGGSYSYTITSTDYKGTTGTYKVPDSAATLTVNLEKALENTALKQLTSIWPQLRRNKDNNGVIDTLTPIKAEDTVLYWATKIGDGYDKNACGCPILVDGYIYTYSGTTLYKVDTVSGNIVATGTMDHASSFAINPPTYADGMIFVGLADGTVQAFNASTLESLWIYKDKLQGQPNSSIVYHDGYIYTGFWVGETNNANYVCISATDEDPTQAKEEKLATWSYTSKGGFYWSGAYVCDDYLLVGTDDGESGYTSGKAKLLSFSTKDGRLIDEAEMEVVGDIRSSITEYDGKYYFTNKGGYFFEAEVNLDGTIKSVKKLKLSNGSNNDLTPAMSTCTPTIYNDRAYVGVSGSSQFGSYTGHNITVIDIKNWEIAYSVATQGYPQTSGVLTTAYEETTGNVYVYFFENYTPGKLRVLEDKPGQTSASITSVESYTNNGVTKNYTTVYNLFEPYGEQAQYSICSPIIDENGTIYFKNDSAYLMAVGSTIDKLEITVQPEKMVYKEGEFFDATGMAVTAYYTNGLSCDVTEYVTWSQDPLTVDDTDFNIVFPYYMYQNNNGETGVSCIEPFDVISITVEPISDVVYGDADNDENINMSDVIIVLKYINGEESEYENIKTSADVNGDENINMEDVICILQYINGTITEFPIEEN